MELYELQYLLPESIYLIPEERLSRPFVETFPSGATYLCIFANEADYRLKNKENKGVFERMIEAVARQQKASTPIYQELFVPWLAEHWQGQHFETWGDEASLQKVLCFGVDLAAFGLPNASAPYRVVSWIAGTELIQADSLALIEQDASLKKALWAALVQMFP